MSGPRGPSASRLPIMSSLAGFGVNGPQRRSANTEPLRKTAAPSFDFSTLAKQWTVDGLQGDRHRLGVGGKVYDPVVKIRIALEWTGL